VAFWTGAFVAGSIALLAAPLAAVAQ